MKNNKGITMTSLIVTIIVMVILAGIALLFSIGDSGIISKAEKTQFLEDMKLYKEELELYKGEKQIENKKLGNPLNAGIGNEFTEWNYDNIVGNKYIPSMKSEYAGKIGILGGELAYMKAVMKDEEEKMAIAAGLIPYEKIVNVTVRIEGEGTVDFEGRNLLLEEIISANVKTSINLNAVPGRKQIGKETVEYTFLGWYVDGKLFEVGNNFEYIVKENVEITARFGSNATIIYLEDGSVELNTNTTLSGYANRKDIIKVEIGINCKSISASAFKNCTNLELKEIPEGVTSIGEFAFTNCSKVQIEKIPESVTWIDKCTFSGCSGIKNLDISNFGNTKGAYITFEGCTGLEEVILGGIGKPVTSITDNRLFNNCIQPKLTMKIYVADGVKSLNVEPWGATNATIEYYSSVTGELVNMSLGQRYKGNTEINFTEIPNAEKITKIKANAFEGCTNLALTSLPKNLISIGVGAFRNCTNLVIKSIPESVTSIGEFAFTNCNKIEISKLPESITSIEKGVFSGCTKITIQKIPENVTFIGATAFANCISIIRLEIPNVANIRYGWEPFSGCNKITEIVLGNVTNLLSDTKTITSNVFVGCLNLNMKIYVEQGITSLPGVPWGAQNVKVEYLN